MTALRGESTSLYLYDPRAHERLHEAIPQARLNTNSNLTQNPGY